MTKFYDPLDWGNTVFFNTDLCYIVFIGIYSIGVLLNIAFPNPVTLNGVIQAFVPVINGILSILVVFYLLTSLVYDPYGLRQSSDWFKTDKFWVWVLLIQLIVIVMSVTWPYSFQVSTTVWYQFVIPIINQLCYVLGALALVVYFLWDPYHWGETVWFTHGLLIALFAILYVISIILGSFPTLLSTGVIFPKDVIQFQNTTGQTLASLQYITAPSTSGGLVTKGNSYVFTKSDASGNVFGGFTLNNNDSCYLVPQHGFLIATGADRQMYGIGTILYKGALILTPIGSMVSPFSLYVTGKPPSSVYRTAEITTSPVIDGITVPFQFVQLTTNSIIPSSFVIANCNPCTDGPSTITITSSSYSHTFTLDTYGKNASNVSTLQPIACGINALPSTIYQDSLQTDSYTLTPLLNIGQININNYVVVYAEHKDGTSSCSVIYNSGVCTIFDLENSTGALRFYEVAQSLSQITSNHIHNASQTSSFFDNESK